MLKKWFGKTETLPLNESFEERVQQATEHTVPTHIAIIMDGNGRWAKKRNLPRVAGHHEGMKTVRKITRFADRLGVKALTVYAFSTENWKRPRTEVEFIMKLPQEFLGDFLPEMIERNIRVETIGEPEQLPAHTRKSLAEAMEATKHNTGLVLTFALNYGSRAEIIQATQKIAQAVQVGELRVEDITEQTMNEALMTANLPEPELLIRTSGEVRLSNFMLWQLAYTEFFFADVNWPDFSEEHLLEAVESFQGRDRRFGGLKGGEA